MIQVNIRSQWLGRSISSLPSDCRDHCAHHTTARRTGECCKYIYDDIDYSTSDGKTPNTDHQTKDSTDSEKESHSPKVETHERDISFSSSSSFDSSSGDYD
jgi:hypothetical protein